MYCYQPRLFLCLRIFGLCHADQETFQCGSLSHREIEMQPTQPTIAALSRENLSIHDPFSFLFSFF